MEPALVSNDSHYASLIYMNNVFQNTVQGPETAHSVFHFETLAVVPWYCVHSLIRARIPGVVTSWCVAREIGIVRAI